MPHESTKRANPTETQTSRRQRQRQTKSCPTTVPGYIYIVFKNLPTRKPWDHAERMHLSITEEELDRELARSQEPGREPAAIMASLPPAQLKHITKLQSETNKLEKSSRYAWQVVSLSQDKPVPELGNVPQTMWAILKREKLEKSERSKKPSKHRRTKASVSGDRPTLSHEELQRSFTQQYVLSQQSMQQYNPETYVEQVSIYSSYFCSAQPVESTSTDLELTYPSSTDETDSNSSGYSSDGSDTGSVKSNLTTGSSASSDSDTSIATPPVQRVPLRSCLRKTRREDTSCSGSEVSIKGDSSDEHSSAEIDSSKALQRISFSGVSPNPFKRSYIGLAPHAEKAEESEETSTALTVTTTTRKTRFSDQASFCLAYDYMEYDSAEESEVEEVHYRSLSTRWRRSGGERLAISKYVTYGYE